MPLTPSTLYRYLSANALGLENAITAQALADEWRVRPVVIRELIHDLRIEGAIIGSSSTGEHRGFFIPVSRDEALLGVDHLISRLRSLRDVHDAQLDAIGRRWPLQPSLFDSPSAVPGGARVSRASSSRPYPGGRGSVYSVQKAYNLALRR